jgi:chemotaxis protein MotB
MENNARIQFSEPVPPIIVKRKKVFVVTEEHGGACMVAYADFVTAMMAFFLLMWLVSATTETLPKGPGRVL